MNLMTAMTGLQRQRLSRVAVIVAAMAFLCAPWKAFAQDESALLAEVHFDVGSNAVTPGGLAKIQKAVAAIKKRNPAGIQVIGFTDSTGDEAINQKISLDRAENVARLLEKQGITIPMIVKGMGEKGAPYKIEDNVSEPLNRCVGIIALYSAEPLL